jgi:hypothetical protein
VQELLKTLSSALPEKIEKNRGKEKGNGSKYGRFKHFFFVPLTQRT